MAEDEVLVYVYEETTVGKKSAAVQAPVANQRGLEKLSLCVRMKRAWLPLED